ncbi:YbaB/EbfC family nucleoid-associated protein [Catelliglobosispora koreensis]|uniref:YbaB/EbfC family nucleoid-associated protein n=1 Tax=Catelliglobosispora koreensis TaxID=129052 RepID=UPI0003752EE4|nr:YbaB/EbfC family nucleoid-associated protein [Catelliglobosispora koreensis]
MPSEIDDVWIEEAVSAYRQIEERQAAFARALTQLEVSVRSPDDVVEVIVGGDGVVRHVNVHGSLPSMSNADLSRSIQQAASAAHEAAAWARRKLHDETFGDYRSLGD